MIGAGFLGCGAIAREHLLAFREVDGIEARAYYDLNPAAAQKLAAEFGGAVSRSADDLVRRDDVDAVYICPYHDTHRQFALAAAEFGKNIMIEKPMAITADDCRAIVDEVARSGITMMSAFKLRYYPMVERAREFCPRPVLATAHVLDNRWPDEFWAQDPVKGGGNCLSQGVHAMDLLCHLFDDEPDRVQAEGGAVTHPGGAVVDTMVATIRFRRGGVASVALADAGLTPFNSKFSFQLADGQRTVHLHDRLQSGEFFDGATAWSARDDRELGMVRENQEFVNAIREKRSPATSAREGMRATLMVLAAFTSLATGEPQHVGTNMVP